MPPRYRPEHAAPVFGGPPRRWRARRAIKLVVATSSWVAALCLVVGAIALVAGATQPGRLHANASGGLNNPGLGLGDQAILPGPSRHTGPHTSPVRRTPPAVQQPTGGADLLHPSRASARPTVFNFHGTGTWFHTLKLLSLVSAGKWQLYWSFRCPANEVDGSFAVTETGTAAARSISFSASGPGGQGHTSLEPGGRTPHLAVTASCPWTVKVVGRP